MDGTITTSTGTSTSGGADIHITSVERLYPISVADYNDARASLVELQEPQNDNKPISQSISEVISDVKNYQPTYNSNHDDPNDEDSGVVYTNDKSFVGTLSNIASDVSNSQPTYNSNHDEEAINEDTYDLNDPE